MYFSTAVNSIKDKTPAEIKEYYINLYSAMTTERFFEHMKNQQNMSIESGSRSKRMMIDSIIKRLKRKPLHFLLARLGNYLKPGALFSYKKEDK